MRLSSVALVVHASLALGALSSTDRAVDLSLPQPAPKSKQRLGAADFRAAAWIVGTWRGTGGDGTVFYERYEWLNDSTITMLGSKDSTFARLSDSARIELRGGYVRQRSGRATWELVGWSRDRLTFFPVAGARNSFSWTRQPDGSWIATLTVPTHLGSRDLRFVMRHVTSSRDARP